MWLSVGVWVTVSPSEGLYVVSSGCLCNCLTLWGLDSRRICEMDAGGWRGLYGGRSFPVDGCNFTVIVCRAGETRQNSEHITHTIRSYSCYAIMTHSFIHSHSLTHSLTQAFIHSLNHSFIHSYKQFGICCKFRDTGWVFTHSIEIVWCTSLNNLTQKHAESLYSVLAVSLPMKWSDSKRKWQKWFSKTRKLCSNQTKDIAMMTWWHEAQLHKEWGSCWATMTTQRIITYKKETLQKQRMRQKLPAFHSGCHVCLAW